MKKIIFPTLLVLAAVFTSCKNDPSVAGQELPTLEQQWANDLIKPSYPDWKEPDYAPVK